MTIISTNVGKNPWEKMDQPSELQKSLKCSTGCNLKNDKMILVHFQDKSFNIRVVQVYVPTTTAKEDEVEWFYEELQDLIELTPKKKNKKTKKQEKKRCPFHHRGLECKK